MVGTCWLHVVRLVVRTWRGIWNLEDLTLEATSACCVGEGWHFIVRWEVGVGLCGFFGESLDFVVDVALVVCLTEVGPRMASWNSD